MHLYLSFQMCFCFLSLKNHWNETIWGRIIYLLSVGFDLTNIHLEHFEFYLISETISQSEFQSRTSTAEYRTTACLKWLKHVNAGMAVVHIWMEAVVTCRSALKFAPVWRNPASKKGKKTIRRRKRCSGPTTNWKINVLSPTRDKLCVQPSSSCVFYRLCDERMAQMRSGILFDSRQIKKKVVHFGPGWSRKLRSPHQAHLICTFSETNLLCQLDVS